MPNLIIKFLELLLIENNSNSATWLPLDLRAMSVIFALYKTEMIRATLLYIWL